MEDLELLHFLCVLVGAVGMLLILGDLNAPKIDWVCETAPEDTFGYQLPEFVHVSGMVQHYLSGSMGIRPKIFSP